MGVRISPLFQECNDWAKNKSFEKIRRLKKNLSCNGIICSEKINNSDIKYLLEQEHAKHPLKEIRYQNKITNAFF